MPVIVSFEISDKEIEHFWSRVDKSGDCWIWTGHLNPKGYGTHKLHQVNFSCHRLAYLFTYNTLPSDKLICHTCDNPKCVRPDHLFVGTHLDNAQDMVRKGRNRCGINHHLSQYHRAVQPTKLTDDQVRELRLLASQGVGQRELSVRFGIARSHVHRIIHRQKRASVV